MSFFYFKSSVKSALYVQDKGIVVYTDPSLLDANHCCFIILVCWMKKQSNNFGIDTIIISMLDGYCYICCWDINITFGFLFCGGESRPNSQQQKKNLGEKFVFLKRQHLLLCKMKNPILVRSNLTFMPPTIWPNIQLIALHSLEYLSI